MNLAIFFIFIIGYAAITMEHTLKIDKLVPALLMMVLSWAIIFIGIPALWLDPSIGLLVDPKCGQLSIPELTGSIVQKRELIESTLLHHFGKTSEILIFLIGAMTIVEIIDHFDGFQVFKSVIKTKSKLVLLWVICLLAFFLSALIDNLTATIVLISILRKIVTDSDLRKWYAGFIIIAANAGGAWSPIGDVTTTMLWMNHFWMVLAIAENENFAATEIAIYLSGVVFFGTLGWGLILWMTKQHGDLGLYGYQGYVRQHPLVAFLFLLAVLGLIGFPISPTFIGEDLLFSHIHEDQFVLAFLAALAFVMEGVAAIRIYARLFLGTVPESTIDSHSASLPTANTKKIA